LDCEYLEFTGDVFSHFVIAAFRLLVTEEVIDRQRFFWPTHREVRDYALETGDQDTLRS
jgi:hypothetical protein